MRKTTAMPGSVGFFVLRSRDRRRLGSVAVDRLATASAAALRPARAGAGHGAGCQRCGGAGSRLRPLRTRGRRHARPGGPARAAGRWRALYVFRVSMNVFRGRYRRASLGLRRALSLAPAATDDLAGVETHDAVVGCSWHLSPSSAPPSCHGSADGSSAGWSARIAAKSAVAHERRFQATIWSRQRTMVRLSEPTSGRAGLVLQIDAGDEHVGELEVGDVADRAHDFFGVPRGSYLAVRVAGFEQPAQLMSPRSSSRSWALVISRLARHSGSSPDTGETTLRHHHRPGPGSRRGGSALCGVHRAASHPGSPGSS